MAIVEIFPREIQEALGEYVYTLSDPSAGDFSVSDIFYVGKGVGDRCFVHARGISDGAVDDPSLKLTRIRSILSTGETPHVRVVAHGLTRPEAHRLEALLIGAVGGLTNAVSGHGAQDYWLSKRDLEARYSLPLGPRDIGEPFLLVSLNGGKHEPPYPDIADDPATLARRTLGDWVVGRQSAVRVRFVLGVYKGLIRTVARIQSDDRGSSVFQYFGPERAGAKSRVRFVGDLDEELEQRWTNKRLTDEGEYLTTFPRQRATRLIFPK